MLMPPPGPIPGEGIHVDGNLTPVLYDAHGRWLNPGGAEALVRKPGGDLAPTVFPLPTRPLSELTPQMRRTAIGATYTGRLEEAADLYRQLVTENGFYSGILATMAHGILGMPHTFQGREDMCEALDTAGGTASEYAAMFPENEAAQVFADGIGFGIGLGQFIYDGRQRAPGANRVGRLEWRDPRWLWRNPISLQWYYTNRAGMRAINPGDGEWFMYQPYPDVDAWRHGPWLYMTLAGIFERDTEFDRQRVSEVTTPTPVMRAEKPTTKESRKQALLELKDLAHENRIVLPEQWTYEIKCATGEYNDVTTSIVEWSYSMVEVGLTGNMMGLKAQAAFADANVYRRTTTDRRRFYGKGWCRTVRRDGLTYWGGDNYLDANVPTVHIDVESPDDKLAAGKALEQEGAALEAIRDGADAVGFDVDPEWVKERAQARGYRLIRRAAAPQVTSLNLGAEQVAAVVRGSVALASLGFEKFGDKRDDMTLAELANAAKAGGAPGAPPPPAAPSAPAPVEARAAERDEEADGDEAEDAARLAGEYTAAKLDRCPYHGRTHSCPRCGVRRAYGLDPATGEPRIAWRPIATFRARGDQDRDSGGKFAGGAGHIKDVGGSFENGPHGKAHWAATKAAETGKTVYATPSDERHSEGFKLTDKLGAGASKKGYSAVHPDGSITHHNGGADRGKMHVYDDGKGGKVLGRAANCRARAAATARSIIGPEYKGAVPLPVDMAGHAATTAEPIETYDPRDVGGWLYVLEPPDESWIGFVGVDGEALLWTERDLDGGVVGTPYSFQRHDLALSAARAA